MAEQNQEDLYINYWLDNEKYVQSNRTRLWQNSANLFV
jgi:hypothetical protein